jgi:hypothetical protein
MLIDIDSKTKEEVQAHLKKVICKPEYVSYTVVCHEVSTDFVLLSSLFFNCLVISIMIPSAGHLCMLNCCRCCY